MWCISKDSRLLREPIEAEYNHSTMQAEVMDPWEQFHCPGDHVAETKAEAWRLLSDRWAAMEVRLWWEWQEALQGMERGRREAARLASETGG